MKPIFPRRAQSTPTQQFLKSVSQFVPHFSDHDLRQGSKDPSVSLGVYFGSSVLGCVVCLGYSTNCRCKCLGHWLCLVEFDGTQTYAILLSFHFDLLLHQEQAHVLECHYTYLYQARKYLVHWYRGSTKFDLYLNKANLSDFFEFIVIVLVAYIAQGWPMRIPLPMGQDMVHHSHRAFLAESGIKQKVYIHVIINRDPKYVAYRVATWTVP